MTKENIFEPNTFLSPWMINERNKQWYWWSLSISTGLATPTHINGLTHFNKILNNRPRTPQQRILVGPQLLDEKIQRFGLWWIKITSRMWGSICSGCHQIHSLWLKRWRSIGVCVWGFLTKGSWQSWIAKYTHKDDG
jgi:hypothetical protein